MTPKPEITVYFLGASRAIRIAWLLEELKLPYNLVSSPRGPDNLAPPKFKEKVPAPLSKSPTIKDGDIVIQESAAIAEYHKFMPSPSSPSPRAKVREYMAAAEGTFLMHALAILYARLHMPESGEQNGTLTKLEEALSKNVHNDLNWMETELERNGTVYLVGVCLTAADIVVVFSLQFIFARRLGVGDKDERKWKIFRDWLRRMECEEGYV
ncbi:putative glutathione s-transferase iii [Phaeomoniella chlamydospora]|uniref:Putative glutathione s-transferase iii n=1 Tax=Phaeomoniella chlamydospora TaxID=158046 RepID=A0A0G2E555_PHACM|nr:putative glutathione s-transferase iii [Phaeomoniella chlamydospora]